jgi:hypothetical protein
MDDFSVSGMSAFSGGNYNAQFDGGAQDHLQFGLRTEF